MRNQPSYLVVSAVALLLLTADFCLARGRRAPSDDRQEHLSIGGTDRTYFLHIPEGLAGGKTAPLVLVFHGGGGHAATMPGFTHFDDLADREGFLVAYPEGINKHWSDTRGLSPADDVGFIRTLIAELERSHHADPKRIYATGISNGGFFSQRLACDLTDKLAAVASVAATMPETLVPVCKPSVAISVMFIQGDNDPLVHIEGGAIARTHGRNVSLAEASSFWRKWNQTSSKPDTQEIPDGAHDGTSVRRETYRGGKQGVEVVVYTVEGGGHTWPGGPQYLPAFLVGKASHNLDATAVIWEFFRKQQRQ
jgi:polyhydroxybutyrate depolymerase